MEAFIDRLCVHPDPSLISKTLDQLAAARRQLAEVEDTAELTDFLVRLYRRVDEIQTIERQAAYDRDQQAAERTLAERIVDLFRRSPPVWGYVPPRLRSC